MTDAVAGAIDQAFGVGDAGRVIGGVSGYILRVNAFAPPIGRGEVEFASSGEAVDAIGEDGSSIPDPHFIDQCIGGVGSVSWQRLQWTLSVAPLRGSGV